MMCTWSTMVSHVLHQTENKPWHHDLSDSQKVWWCPLLGLLMLRTMALAKPVNNISIVHLGVTESQPAKIYWKPHEAVNFFTKLFNSDVQRILENLLPLQ